MGRDMYGYIAMCRDMKGYIGVFMNESRYVWGI